MQQFKQCFLARKRFFTFFIQVQEDVEYLLYKRLVEYVYRFLCVIWYPFPLKDGHNIFGLPVLGVDNCYLAQRSTGLLKLLWRLKVRGPTSVRMALLGIRKKWRQVRKYAGLSTFLYVDMNESGRRMGVRLGELSWTLEDNGPVNVGIKMMGGQIYKRYRVYQKDL